MPKKKPMAPSAVRKKKPIESYTHKGKKRANNPPVGLVTPETDPDEGKKTYAYDPHLDPQVTWAGKKEHTSFHVPTVSLHVHERIDPLTIVEAVKRKNGAQDQMSLFASSRLGCHCAGTPMTATGLGNSPYAADPIRRGDGAGGMSANPQVPYGLIATSQGLGARVRGSRPGPERDLVDSFLTDFPIPAPAGQRVTVFREPRLESGSPDIVAVSWREVTAAGWPVQRAQLRPGDLRLLHLLGSFGPLEEGDFKELGEVDPWKSLKRLGQLQLIRFKGATWRAAPVCQTFAVIRIVSFEAKLGDWTRAIEQASVNRWFASESYVLISGVPRTSTLTVKARSAGVGVWVAGARRPLLVAPRDPVRQPISYASWLFNEWAWRSAGLGAAGSP